jgi:hypothetical protein
MVIKLWPKMLNIKKKEKPEYNTLNKAAVYIDLAKLVAAPY